MGSTQALMPVYSHLPFFPVRGEGLWLEDVTGRRVLDLWGGHAVSILGHGHPRLLEALSQQAGELLFQSNALPMAVREEAAAALVAFAPPGLDQVFFVNSGAEANENALRLALRSTGRERVVALSGGFHGRTAAAGAASAGSARWYGFPRAPFETAFVTPGDASALERAVTGEVAAVILEPVQGMGGAVGLGRDYLATARELTSDRGALLIFDEVQCGMGRTGHPFAAQHFGVTPDLLTVAKGLAGGFPAGAVLARPQVAVVARPGDLGSTFGGGPAACAMVLAVLRAIAEEGLLERVRRLAPELHRRCLVGPVREVQGVGYLVGMRTTRPAAQIVLELLERGVLAGTSADPHVMRLLPPLTLEEEHVELLAAALEELAP
jgi:acetylornithine/N-succinyldiaminopimelate aminotransferase